MAVCLLSPVDSELSSRNTLMKGCSSDRYRLDPGGARSCCSGESHGEVMNERLGLSACRVLYVSLL